jgi:hypothetical protein
MTSYIQNYGFTKTMIQDRDQIRQNDIQWNGNYDGNIAKLNVNINDNGNKEFVSMQLTNEDLKQLLGIQPVNISLEKRLMNDFLTEKQYKPITLEGSLIRKKSRKHRKRHTNKRRKSYRNK